MFDRITPVILMILCAIILVMMLGIFVNTINAAASAARISEYQSRQVEAMRSCMELGQVEGFWVNDVTYCKAVFMGNSSIIPYDELDKIINKHQ